MNGGNEMRDTEAIGWVIRLRDPATADWDAFTAWLEADPANNTAYESVAMADQDYEGVFEEQPVLPEVAAAIDNAFGWTSLRARIAGGLVAVAALGVAVISVGPFNQSTEIVATETAPGQYRNLVLSDGSHVALNGATRISWTKGKDRHVRIDRGEAMFTIDHDASNPFVVEAGDAKIQDVGTRFNVIHDRGVLDVSVAEGEILYDPDGRALHVKAGSALELHRGAQAIVTRSIEPEGVGSWRFGRLSYRNAALERVAADLSRTMGVEIAVDEAISSRTFSGVLVVRGDRDTLLERLGPVLGVQPVQDGPTWRLTARPDETD